MRVATEPVVLYRTYSRLTDGRYETWDEIIRNRVVPTLNEMEGSPLPSFAEEMMLEKKVLPSGRFLWVAGTEWSKKPENYPGFYNCMSINVDRLNAFGILMDNAMMGTGTGAVLVREYLDKLPPIANKVKVKILNKPGHYGWHQELTEIEWMDEDAVQITVGDSRQGWVEAYQSLINIAADASIVGYEQVEVYIDLGFIRPHGSPLKGFGGVANPVRLETLFLNVADVLSGAAGRKLNTMEVILLIDEAAAAVVAGNIRRSAGMRQGDPHDPTFVGAKAGLYYQDENGHWRVDPKREVLRMANHTEVHWNLPTLGDIKNSVDKQFTTGEGAFMYAPNAVRRTGNPRGYGLNPCGEIMGENFYCNLSEVHLNLLDPDDLIEQRMAFQTATLIAAPLLLQKFTDPVMQESREHDPIIGVSFTGLFDFFVKKWGRPWLEWMFAGRPIGHGIKDYAQMEAFYLDYWRRIVLKTLQDWCKKHDYKLPTRYTTVQPAGSKSLLTGASPGWHPPKYASYIRRITIDRYHPVAQAALEYGYNIVPAQSSIRDGQYITDPFDKAVTEWLIEIPVRVEWADLAEGLDLNKLPAVSQLGLWMNVQMNYTTHNTSATVELYDDEREQVAALIHQYIATGLPYISTTLLPRVAAPFPLMPFEPTTLEDIEKREQRLEGELPFEDFLNSQLNEGNAFFFQNGPAGCDSSKCLQGTDELSYTRTSEF